MFILILDLNLLGSKLILDLSISLITKLTKQPINPSIKMIGLFIKLKNILTKLCDRAKEIKFELDRIIFFKKYPRFCSFTNSINFWLISLFLVNVWLFFE